MLGMQFKYFSFSLFLPKKLSDIAWYCSFSFIYDDYLFILLKALISQQHRTGLLDFAWGLMKNKPKDHNQEILFFK